jgi:AraC-like DNA-binding protein
MNRESLWPLAHLPQVVKAGCFAIDDRDFSVVHCCPTSAIHLYRYAGNLRLDAQQYALTPGDLSITPASCRASYHLPRPGQHWCLHLADQAPVSALLATLPRHLSLGAAADMAQERFERIARHHDLARSGVAAAQAAAAAATLELLAWLATLSSPARPALVGPSDLAVERAATLLRSGLAKDLGASQVARAVGLSRNWLSIRFHARYGMTMAAFRRAARIAEARALILGSDLTLAEIGRRVGLPDAQHFTKCFKACTGHPPSHLRGGRAAPVPQRR